MAGADTGPPTTPTDTGTGTAPAQPLGEGTYDLFIPTGFENIMEPREGGYEAGVRELFATQFPSAAPHELDALVEGAGVVHGAMRDRGIIYHSLASVPAGTVIDGEVFGDVNWMFFAQVVEVPVTGEVDTGELAARVLGSRITAPGTEIVPFESAMGWGVAVLGTLALPDVATYVKAFPDAVDGEPRPMPESLVVAATITGAPYQGWGLLCTGYALEPRYQLAMAAVVAAMGRMSRVHPGAVLPPDGQPPTPADEAP